MFKKFFLNLFFILGLSIMQVAFIYSLPVPFSSLNLIIIAVVFISVFSGFKPAFWLAIGSGVFLDLYSFQPLGSHTISLAAVVVVINFFLVNFFTNRSLYSFLLLIILAGAAYKLFLILYDLLASSFGWFNFILPPISFLLIKELKGALLNIILAVFIFYLTSFISRRFQPVFLKK